MYERFNGYDEIEPCNTRCGNKIIYGIVDKQLGILYIDLVANRFQAKKMCIQYSPHSLHLE